MAAALTGAGSGASVAVAAGAGAGAGAGVAVLAGAGAGVFAASRVVCETVDPVSAGTWAHAVAESVDTTIAVRHSSFTLVTLEDGRRAGTEVTIENRDRVHAEPLVEQPRVHGSEVGFIANVA